MLFLFLILFILIYEAPLPFLLRVGHVTLLFLWMIFLDILGFISSKIVMNFIKYHDFTKMIEAQFSKPIKLFRSHNAQEYKANELTSILHQFGTIPHSSCAGTSQKSGRAESKLHHILDVVRATTISASTPSQF